MIRSSTSRGAGVPPRRRKWWQLLPARAMAEHSWMGLWKKGTAMSVSVTPATLALIALNSLIAQLMPIGWYILNYDGQRQTIFTF